MNHIKSFFGANYLLLAAKRPSLIPVEAGQRFPVWPSVVAFVEKYHLGGGSE